MERHSSIVFILCIKLLLALAVQSAIAAPTLNYLSDNCKKKLKSFKVETPSYDLFNQLKRIYICQLYLKGKVQKMFKLNQCLLNKLIYIEYMD